MALKQIVYSLLIVWFIWFYIKTYSTEFIGQYCEFVIWMSSQRNWPNQKFKYRKISLMNCKHILVLEKKNQKFWRRQKVPKIQSSNLFTCSKCWCQNYSLRISMFMHGPRMHLMQKLSAMRNWPNYRIFPIYLPWKNAQNNLEAIFFWQTKTMIDEEIKILD
jgi:hypothetical protein